MFKFEIDIYERTREQKQYKRETYIYSERNPVTIKLKSNILKLTIATLKACLDVKPALIHTNEFISVFFKVVSAFECSNKKIYAKQICCELKDSNKSNRIGDIGQGIAYLVTQEIFKHPIIHQYEMFANENNIKIGGKNPDFIASKIDDTFNYILIESKSGFNMSEKTEKSNMTKGLKQIENALNRIKESNINIKNSYAICSSIPKKNNKDKSAEAFVSYIDPAGESGEEKTNREKIFLYYSKFFTSLGLHKVSEKLRCGDFISRDLFNNPHKTHDKYNLVSKSDFIKVYLELSVINFLCGISQKIEFEYEPIETEFDIAIFADGTLYDLNKNSVNRHFKSNIAI